jgi:hypothetical protein
VRRRFASTSVVLLASFAGGCATFVRPIDRVEDRMVGERILVGDVHVEGERLSGWVPGRFVAAQVSFADDLPGAETREAWAGSLGDPGGVFRVAAPKAALVYVRGLHVSSAVDASNVESQLPFYFKVPASTNACEYIGTFFVRRDGDRIIAEVVDLFDRHADAYQSYVPGCPLRRALATPPTDEEIALAIQRIKDRKAAAAARSGANPGRPR